MEALRSTRPGKLWEEFNLEMQQILRVDGHISQSSWLLDMSRCLGCQCLLQFSLTWDHVQKWWIVNCRIICSFSSRHDYKRRDVNECVVARKPVTCRVK